jgi:hypothetical protein
MAFEIYNGLLTGSDTEKGNTMIDKLAEMWDFDEVDTSSSLHYVRYGENAKLMNNSLQLLAIAENDGIGFMGYYSGATSYTIVKAANSILLTWEHDSAQYAVIIGNLRDGGKGIVGLTDSAFYSIMEDAAMYVTRNVTIPYRQTLEGTQLIDILSDSGSLVMENGYQVIAMPYTSSTARIIKGEYSVNGQGYYIAGRAAIKEE